MAEQQPEHQDKLIRGIDNTLELRVVAARCTHSASEACRRQGATQLGAMALARMSVAANLLATLAKADKERLRLQLRAPSSPLGGLMADAHGDGRVRACIARADAPVISASRGQSLKDLEFDQGELVLTRDLGLARPYQGSVALESGELDEDLQRYLSVSEQLPSALKTWATLDPNGRLHAAFGVLVQSFPGAQGPAIEEVRERLKAPELVHLVDPKREPSDLAAAALGGRPFEAMGALEPQFFCPCGPERARAVLGSLGAADLRALADEQEITTVSCNFCGAQEDLSSAEVLKLAESLERGRS